MKSFFVLSFILSCYAANQSTTYEVPKGHFDVDYNTDPPNDSFGHFHMYVEVDIKASEQEDEFWIRSKGAKTVSTNEILQNFIKENTQYKYAIDEEDESKLIL